MQSRRCLHLLLQCRMVLRYIDIIDFWRFRRFWWSRTLEKLDVVWTTEELGQLQGCGAARVLISSSPTYHDFAPQKHNFVRQLSVFRNITCWIFAAEECILNLSFLVRNPRSLLGNVWDRLGAVRHRFATIKVCGTIRSIRTIHKLGLRFHPKIYGKMLRTWDSQTFAPSASWGLDITPQHLE